MIKQAFSVPLLMLVIATFASAQVPSIRITSPASGTTVIAGQSVLVTVQSSPPGAFRQIGLIGQSPLGTHVVNAQDSPSFNILVPANISPGRFALTLVAVDSLGNRVMLSPIELVVDLAVGMPIALTSDVKYLDFKHIGKAFPLSAHVTGEIDVTRSSELRWDVVKDPSPLRGPHNVILPTSPVPTDVVVIANGSAVSKRDGSAVVRGAYRGAIVLIPVTVASSGLRGDLDGDSDVDSNDLAIILDSLGLKPTTDGDARDLNRDGKIDALDSRVLTTLCMRPRCAAK